MRCRRSSRSCSRLILVLLAIPLNYPPLRRKLISDGVLAVFRKILPPMSQTEREAIEAGTVWWDGELFSGRPDWKKLLALPPPRLTAEEQPFLDHECEEVCGMVTDWETTHVYKDLPPPVWQYIKDKGFLGMIIPKEYGGLGFSALAHSQVMTKLATRCSALVGHGDGAQFARAGRAAAALRHRRAEAPLPAAAGQGPGDPLLRAHQSARGIRRGGDPRYRDRLLGRARGQVGAGLAAHLGEALHHAGPGGDAARPRLPRFRPRPPARATRRTSASPAR